MAPKILTCFPCCMEDDEDDNSREGSSHAPQTRRISRHNNLAVDPASYALAEAPGVAAEYGEEDEECCDSVHSSAASTELTAINTTSTTTTSSSNTTNSRMSGIREFWRSFQEKLNLGGITSTTGASTTTSSSEHVPILTQASSFDVTKEVPTIATEQIVLPGSDLQLQMAKAMAAQLDGSDRFDDSYDECVICMEGFDPTNPRMPTLCGCGENKTYFHLPCLYQWVQQSGRKCPSCRKKLRWEEF